MHAELTGTRALRYLHPPAAQADVPSHVRGGSALRRWRDRWVVVQDDVRALATVGEAGEVEAWLMPADKRGERTFDADRGNKRRKLDLEAATVLPDGRLLVFGSGSKPRRERLVVVRAERGSAAVQIELVHAGPLYASLAGEPRFAGPGLNIEGAVVVGDNLRLFQRATAIAAAADSAVNASADLDLGDFLAWLDRDAAAPRPHRIRRYHLGSVDGVALGFTDAALLADGRIAFLACAEATDDAAADGVIVATRFGFIEGESARQGGIEGSDGRASLLKLEGIEPEPGDSRGFHVVSDSDDPDIPARLGYLVVHEG